LSNAQKFTTEGYIKLKLTSSIEDVFDIRITVEDTGKGIEESKIPYVFNLFKGIAD
jgi:signal transduction histidine kinase